ncbi:MAG TPA: hypothetical protein VK501_04680 [Baekduia sp.]|uniref:hypothetical protein n=1 Tax=Baekduia sp. TaxID=2600305 RepID=UPI002C0D92CB|nr:hypothetical protein [Baekduia sp.]HMJ33192.1 hypothetical protein [Baekduia sp.]
MSALAHTDAPPSPASDPAAPRRRGISGGWVPAALLVAGLGLTAWVVASASEVSVSALHQIHADAASLHDVGKTYVDGWSSPAFSPFVDHRLRALTLVLTVAYIASVTAIGGTVVEAIRGSEQWPRTVRLLAGFLPGYMMVLAPLQLLFAAVPLVAAAWISIVAVILAALIAQRRTIASGAVSLVVDPRTRRGSAITAGGVLVLVVLVAVQRLQAGRNFMVTDSVSVLLDAAGAQLSGGAGSHLLQWDQQSDEWLFSAPLMFTSHAGQDFMFPLYAAQCLGMASFACLVFGIVQSFAWRRQKLAAGVATAAVLASTPAIYPWYYISLVGGQNPTIWLGHPGRYAGIVAPWLALLLFGRHRPRAMIAIGFATLGLGFGSVHVAAYVLAALTAALAWTAMRGRRTELTGYAVARATVHLLAAAAIGAPILAYWFLHRVTRPTDVAWWLVAGAAVATVAAVLIGVGTTRHVTRGRLGPVVAWTFAWGATLALGFSLSNNLTDGLAGGHLRTVLGAVLPGYDVPLVSRSLLGDTPMSGLSLFRFSGEECNISGHCLSGGYFLAAYGFLTVVALASWLALGPVTAEASASRCRAAWLLMAGALGLSFVLVDFTGAPLATAWILTRFIEVPYYGLLALAAMAFAASRNRITLIVGSGVLVLWTVIPVVVNLVPLQLVKNADWLAGSVLG